MFTDYMLSEIKLKLYSVGKKKKKNVLNMTMCIYSFLQKGISHQWEHNSLLWHWSHHIEPESSCSNISGTGGKDWLQKLNTSSEHVQYCFKVYSVQDEERHSSQYIPVLNVWQRLVSLSFLT